MVTSVFHLWQFQIFDSGAEELVVVLFWLDLWEIFILATLGFEPTYLWFSSPALYHCAIVTSGFHLWQFQVFNSGAEGLVVVLLWLWEIFFLATLGFEPKTPGSLVLHSTTVPWWLLVFTSDNFRYLTLVQGEWWWYCSDWTCERFSFWPHWGLNPGPLHHKSFTLPLCHGWLLVFTSENFRYLTQVQGDWWWYCFDCTCERFSFWSYRGLNPGPLDL